MSAIAEPDGEKITNLGTDDSGQPRRFDPGSSAGKLGPAEILPGLFMKIGKSRVSSLPPQRLAQLGRPSAQ